MAKQSNLKKPLFAFLADVRRVAYQVSQHADRMSAATQGRIGLGTAKEMERLVEQLTRIDTQRHLTVIPSSRELVREASRLITTIGIAARYAGKTNPQIAESLARTRRGPERRSAAAMKFALEMHAALAHDHPREIGALLPAGTLEEAATVVRGFEEYWQEGKTAREAAAAIGAERAEIVSRLQRLMAETRALVAVLFRGEPGLAEVFVARSPPRPRRRKAAIVTVAEAGVAEQLAPNMRSRCI